MSAAEQRLEAVRGLVDDGWFIVREDDINSYLLKHKPLPWRSTAVMFAACVFGVGVSGCRPGVKAVSLAVSGVGVLGFLVAASRRTDEICFSVGSGCPVQVC